MRNFNKVFVISLPRCATVSTCDALGRLGIYTAHLGKIFGEESSGHNNPARLVRMFDQIAAGEYDLDMLKICDGLADYPACCFDVLSQLDEHYPGSLFINVRRDDQVNQWLQSVERQFVGLQILNSEKDVTDEARAFMEAMFGFRKLTFDQIEFDRDKYEVAYHRYQSRVGDYFANRSTDLLSIPALADLENTGYQLLCNFLECDEILEPFPQSNSHSQLPSERFMKALEAGVVASQTGIRPVNC